MAVKTTDLCDELGDAARIIALPFVDLGGLTGFDGPAATVKCYEDNSRIKEFSLQAGEGRVLVIDAGGSFRCAVLGDIIAGDLVKNGWAGVLLYGCARDKAELAKLSIGIKALGVVPRRSFKRNEGQVGIRLAFGGQAIEEGDRICADEDGVLVIDGN